MEQQSYCAFISYRHESPDQEIAKALHTAIETYGIPGSVRRQTGKKRMGKVFRDQEELPLSSDLGADIEAALDRSEWFIAICSPRYLESKWCLRELEYFIEHKGNDHVLTVLVEGEPKDSFPEMIRFAENADGTKTEIEPLAGDVRAETLSKSIARLKNEKLRLLAPMLGLGFDDLKRRARQRRIRITAAVSSKRSGARRRSRQASQRSSQGWLQKNRAAPRKNSAVPKRSSGVPRKSAKTRSETISASGWSVRGQPSTREKSARRHGSLRTPSTSASRTKECAAMSFLP